LKQFFNFDAEITYRVFASYYRMSIPALVKGAGLGCGVARGVSFDVVVGSNPV
jgi:hypothetical protein